jgi:hypothetical protein
MVCGVERVGRGLINRHRHSLGRRLDLVAAVYRNGLAPQMASPRIGSYVVGSLVNVAS